MWAGTRLLGDGIYLAFADSVAHTNSPIVRNDSLFNVESFRVEAEVLSKGHPALRTAVAHVYFSMSELQTTAAKLTIKTVWTDPQLFSDMNPCHSIWKSLQKDIATFDNSFKAQLRLVY